MILFIVAGEYFRIYKSPSQSKDLYYNQVICLLNREEEEEEKKENTERWSAAYKMLWCSFPESHYPDGGPLRPWGAALFNNCATLELFPHHCFSSSFIQRRRATTASQLLTAAESEKNKTKTKHTPGKTVLRREQCKKWLLLSNVLCCGGAACKLVRSPPRHVEVQAALPTLSA